MKRGTVRLHFGVTELEVPTIVLSGPALNLAAVRAKRKAAIEPDGLVKGKLAEALSDLYRDNSMRRATLDFLLGLGELLPELTWTQLRAALLVMEGLALNREAVLPSRI